MAADFHRSCQIDHSTRPDRRIIANGEMAEALQYLNEHRFIDSYPAPYFGAEEMQASRTKARMNAPPQELFQHHPYTDQQRITHFVDA